MAILWLSVRERARNQGENIVTDIQQVDPYSSVEAADQYVAAAHKQTAANAIKFIAANFHTSFAKVVEQFGLSVSLARDCNNGIGLFVASAGDNEVMRVHLPFKRRSPEPHLKNARWNWELIQGDSHVG